MKIPRDTDLILVGLRKFRDELKGKISQDIEAYQQSRMSLDDLVKYLNSSNRELNKVIQRIEELDPPCNFAADDIPF